MKGKESVVPTFEYLEGPCYWCGITTEQKDTDGEFCCESHKDAINLSLEERIKKFPYHGQWIENLSFYKKRVV